MNKIIKPVIERIDIYEFETCLNLSKVNAKSIFCIMSRNLDNDYNIINNNFYIKIFILFPLEEIDSIMLDSFGHIYGLQDLIFYSMFNSMFKT